MDQNVKPCVIAPPLGQLDLYIGFHALSQSNGKGPKKFSIASFLFYIQRSYLDVHV